MADIIDLLQIKIEKAKGELPEDTQNAINAVDWKAVILNIRETKGYSFEQLGDLEIETELVLCGLLSPEKYPQELGNRMHLSKIEVDDLVKEMNERVFAKIKENLIKNIERKKVFAENSPLEEYSAPKAEGGGQTIHPRASATPEEGNKDTQVLKSAGIEILPEKTELTIPTPTPILAQKLSDSFQVPIVETKHSLNNLTSNNVPTTKPKVDPYREVPE